MGKTDNIVVFIGCLALLAGFPLSESFAEPDDPVADTAPDSGAQSEIEELRFSPTDPTELFTNPADAVESTTEAESHIEELVVSPIDATDPVVEPPAVLTYVDQYLLDDETLPDDWYIEEEQPPGRRFFAAEAVYYNHTSDTFGEELEQGVRGRWRRETLNYGSFEADFAISDFDRDYLGRKRSSTEAMFNLRQTGVPLTDHWTMSNSIGYQRTPMERMQSVGYRVRLFSTSMLGMTGDFINTDKRVRFFAGRTGRDEGIALRQFEKDGGTLIGGTYEQQASSRLTFGGTALTFSGNEDVRAHESVLMAGQYAEPDGTSRYNLNFLADDDANVGFWADGLQLTRSGFLNHFGAYYLAPDLAWMARPIMNDQLGYYFRTDTQGYKYSFSAGYDYLQVGLDRDRASRTRSHSIYLNSSYRLTRRLAVGLSGNVRTRNIYNTESGNQVLWRLNNFASYRFPFLGTSRAEIYASGFDSNDAFNDDEIRGIRLNHDWPMPQRVMLSTEVRSETQERRQSNNRLLEAAVRFRHSVTNNVSLGLHASAIRGTGDRIDSYSALSVNADARWQFLPNWYVSLIVNHNATAIGTDSSTTLDFNDEPEAQTFWLTFGYAKASGQPFSMLGRNTGGIGTGTIAGQVFFDANGDMIRQPGERPAAGVTILLDGRYETRTDSQGRYVFEPVHTGSHRITLLSEELPLPWGLYDESPRPVELDLRNAAKVDFALVELD